MDFIEVTEKYPCPDRRGVGYSGCTCNNTYREDTKLVSCKAYGSHNMPNENCIICPFRLQHEAKTKQLNG